MESKSFVFPGIHRRRRHPHHRRCRRHRRRRHLRRFLYRRPERHRHLLVIDFKRSSTKHKQKALGILSSNR